MSKKMVCSVNIVRKNIPFKIKQEMTLFTKHI